MPGRIHVGHWGAGYSGTGDWNAGQQGPAAPEEVVVCRLDSETFELHCHGGRAASQRIIADLVQVGCTQVAWRRWIEHQECDGIRAAARALLADARTERTATILLDQYNGALHRAINEAVAAIASADAAGTAARLEELLARAAVGLHLVEPWRIVLAGRPNAGKSSLINALVGYRRSIVHDRPGTTRDAVSVATALDSWPVELIDTAGLSAGDDPLEIAAIDRARQQFAAADAVLLVFDATQTWTAELAAIAGQFPAALVVHNKSDLWCEPNAGCSNAAPAGYPPGVATSALNGSGIERLIDQIVGRLIGNEPAVGAAVPVTARQVALLREARNHVDRHDWAAAIAALRAMNEADSFGTAD